jgi:(1->4)-alpha-D-glucan 1-alpha-D-glucosylmutase
MAEPDPIRALIEMVARELERERRFPVATYRLQLHSGFKFRDAQAVVPYLHDLGITDCYASPYLKARPGSKHGYDIQDHRQLNPEIGTEEEYNEWTSALRDRDMGQILDMVPNHMGIAGNENVWWNNVLENGPASPYATYFDIDWFSYDPKLHNRLLLPLLGDPYGTVLESQQLSLRFENGAFNVYYYDHRFPISPCSYGRVLGHRLEELEQILGSQAEPFIEYQSIRTSITHLPSCAERNPVKMEERQREKEVIKRRLATLTETSPAVQQFVTQNVSIFNGVLGSPESFALLDDLLNNQAYRLSWWRVAGDEINYRRFFDVNELAALNMERLEVFKATHELILQMLRERKITGLRIDHPDGLYDPQQYLQRLQRYYLMERVQAAAERDPEHPAIDEAQLESAVREALERSEAIGSPLAQPLYVVVEKILGKDEQIPEDWPVHGTTGYDYLNLLNGLFVDAGNLTPMTRIYQRWTGSREPFRDVVHDKKFLILQVSLSGELHMLGHQLDRLSEMHRWSRDFTLHSLRHALRGIIASFPVYRSYISSRGIPKRDIYYMVAATMRARRKHPILNAALFDFVRDMLSLKHFETASEEQRAEQLRFVGKFQQVTAPVMAKGLEDTTFYVYNRLLSLNEVGGNPEQFGVSVSTFHAVNEARQARWPHALLATSTHDTKRSEDVRARLNVLSELPREWQKGLTRWSALNRRHRVMSDEEEAVAPDRNEEYLIYQTLVGAWPLEPYTNEEFGEFVERIQAYVQKAIHEAKVHTSWTNPNPAHDEAVREFVARVLDERNNRRFLADFRTFQRRISRYGLFNSLAQTLLKITCPGVPDIYQGTEIWDFSLVDPDNRRPVDYGRRRLLLAELRDRLADNGTTQAALARQLTEQVTDGRIKLYLTYQGLQCRREHPELFSTGEYLPAEAAGVRGDHVCGFVRRSGNVCAVVVAPRLIAGLLRDSEMPPLATQVWEDTQLLLPESVQYGHYRNVFTRQVLRPAERNGSMGLPLSEVLVDFPVALLLAYN